jgi:hypothetical protein
MSAYTYIDADDFDVLSKDQVRQQNKSFDPQIKIVKSGWGYYSKIDYKGNGDVVKVIWSKTLKMAHRRAKKKVVKYLQREEWKANPLILTVDRNTHIAIPTGSSALMLESRKD